ncbi:unnamed protein product [Trifolium pratense]|uniref:Uncharacterized protein n=1 Tax=Trifolium pratense TaxID=57577 RepID=A0ACB0L4V2_TRIPR|nr:unnamed protein product [Trifolium pratense]
MVSKGVMAMYTQKKGVMAIKLAMLFGAGIYVFFLRKCQSIVLLFLLINNRTKIMFSLYKRDTLPPGPPLHCLIYLNVCVEVLVSPYYY